MVGLASFFWIAMNASSDPATTGSSFEMYAIAAVVLGGISMSGGKGKCLGILFGSLSYTVIDKIIIALKMNSLINYTQNRKSIFIGNKQKCLSLSLYS